MKNDDITLVSPGCWNFAQYLYRILDSDFSPYNLPVQTPIGILFGVFSTSQTEFFAPLRDCQRKIAIWVGTDVLQLRSYVEKVPDAPRFINEFLDVRLADAPILADELEEIGIKIDDVVETPPKVIFKPTALPEKMVVGIYAPIGRAEFYNTDFCLDIAKKMPDIEFRLYGLNREFGQVTKNVWDLGHISVAQEIESFSAIMRFTRHDGLAIGPIEFMMAGRYAVTNQDIPHAVKTEIDQEKVIKILRDFQKKEKPNTEASEYWQERLAHDKWKARMLSHARSESIGAATGL